VESQLARLEGGNRSHAGLPVALPADRRINTEPAELPRIHNACYGTTNAQHRTTQGDAEALDPGAAADERFYGGAFLFQLTVPSNAQTTDQYVRCAFTTSACRARPPRYGLSRLADRCRASSAVGTVRLA
jgi:hypothetical protein